MAEANENQHNDDQGGNTGLGGNGANNTGSAPATRSSTVVTGGVNSGTTVAGKSNITQSSPTTPGKGGSTGSNGADASQSTYGVNSPDIERLRNPLGVFSSYNYQISLYMLTPAAYSAFINSGRTNISAINIAALSSDNKASQNQQAFLIAQSGGVNRNETRANKLEFDYYIDNLKITNNLQGPANQNATNVTEITFQIVEPYGFNFVSQLRRARDEVVRLSGGKSNGGPGRQIFLLGVRFIGYDKDGNVITGKESFAGRTLDQKGTYNGVFESYYDIFFTGFKYAIDGRSVTYNITATSAAPNVGFGIKYGRVDNGVELQGETVGEMFNNLIEKLNKTSETVNTNPNVYSVVFRDDAEKIKNAKMITKSNPNVKQKAPSTADKTAQVNDKTAAKSAPNPKLKIFSVPRDSSILQIVDQIIAESSYLQDALTVLKKSTEEQQTALKEGTQVKPTNNQQVSWYNISTKITPRGWDEKRNDFAWDIQYIIGKYDTPLILSPYFATLPYYYGPVKRYDYWYTGKNSEILSYKQDLNYNYFSVNVAGITVVNQATTGPDVAMVPNKTNDQVRTGTLNEGLEAVNSYRTSLYDPGSWAAAKIQILGDPDFLMQDSTDSLETVYKKFYNNNGSINANTGQVFIEISFKEAIDYNIDSGVMNINESIFFYNYPKDVRDQIKGISYQVTKCVSTFNQGKFIQDLELSINTRFETAQNILNKESQRPNTTNSAAGAANPSTKEANEARITLEAGDSLRRFNNPNAAPPSGQATVKTKTGIVADDDSASSRTRMNKIEANTGGREG
jgi:hypothetical protein